MRASAAPTGARGVGSMNGRSAEELGVVVARTGVFSTKFDVGL